jgi:hypothetical protein
MFYKKHRNHLETDKPLSLVEMNTAPIYIFDLDGTLANIGHRLHFVKGEGKRDWDSFFDTCDKDEPYLDIINILKKLSENGFVWIWSGRRDSVKEKTIKWLDDHIGLDYIDRLKMRPDGDYTADNDLKESWLLALPWTVRPRLVVFDDRDRLVAMYRRHKIRCLQVREGNF